MTLELRGQLNQLRLGQRVQISLRHKAIGRGQATNDSRRRRSETTGVRNGVAAAHDQARQLGTRGGQAAVDRPDHQVLRTQRHLSGALPLDLDEQAAIRGLDDDLVVETQRQPKAVEAGAQIGAGRRNGGAGASDRQAGS